MSKQITTTVCPSLDDRIVVERQALLERRFKSASNPNPAGHLWIIDHHWEHTPIR